MLVGYYQLTEADIGLRQFTFQYTNGTALNPNGLGECIDKVSASPQQNVMVVPLPKCDLTKHCLHATNITGNEVVVTYSGTVSNSGVTTLTNLTIFNDQPAPNTPVFSINSLAVGESVTFTNSYTNNFDLCGPWTDVLTVTGQDIYTCPVSNASTDTCSIVYSPAISVTKQCPVKPVPPGGLLTFSGTVSNSGNAVLTNVLVYNDQPAPDTLVIGPITLGLGEVVSFSGSYTVPLDSCGPYPDTVTAIGTSICGTSVTNTATQSCPGTTTPRIAVTKRCPIDPVVPGGIAVFSGTVSNAGNITLTNVIVVNNVPTNNTPVFGPVTLAPGESMNFTGSENVPANCCAYFDILTASGANICTGSNVVATAGAVCPTLTIPAISVTKHCPPYAVPLGQLLVYSGVVSNSGNVTLTNVTVVDDQPTNNTLVLGPITLAPGQSMSYSGSYVVPIDICDLSLADTVTASGFNVCSGSKVTANDHTDCAIIPFPRITITKLCPPNPVAPGEVLVYSGTVSNAGDTTITNVTVVNDRPVSNTFVLGPITLAPGESTNFTGSYIAPYDCCGPCVDTLTAHGQEICAGGNIVATASDACPRITTPEIKVTRDCPTPPVNLGELVFFTGAVSNSGNATLANVWVIDDQAGVVLDSQALAPGDELWFWGMYFANDCGSQVPSGVTATANDICTDVLVTNRFETTCAVACPPTQQVTIFAAQMNGANFEFSFETAVDRTNIVQYSDSLLPENWQNLTNLWGDGNVATIQVDKSSDQRFYRVMLQ